MAAEAAAESLHLELQKGGKKSELGMEFVNPQSLPPSDLLPPEKPLPNHSQTSPTWTKYSNART